MVARTGARDALPTSHFFVTIARGPSARTFVARSGLGFAALILTPLLGVWLLASTLYIVFHDDLVASLMLRQRDMQYGYEDRIAALRSQIDRETTHKLVSQRSIETKLDALTAREAELQNRSGMVARLQEQASHITGLSGMTRVAGVRSAPTLSSSVEPATGDRAPSPLAEQVAHDHAAPKPRPEAALLPADFADGPAHAVPAPDRLSALANGLDEVSAAQENQIAALDTRARRTIGRYRDALSVAGLTENRLVFHAPRDSGGPFVPLAGELDASPFARAAVGLQLTLSQAEQLSTTIAHVPFSKPLEGDPEITSPFGPRVDPFLGRPAMHTGIDLSEDTGTGVLATAPGRVTVAGPMSGYGNMVEIDHGAGLTTRYAHLSATDVSLGEVVRLGETIGRVGATGRATGPHLHYETRIDGEPVDPLRFLAAGQRIFASAEPTK